MMITSIVPGSKLEAGKTCIVLDEIQECPNARTALKFFKLDGRFDVIGTGHCLEFRITVKMRCRFQWGMRR